MGPAIRAFPGASPGTHRRSGVRAASARKMLPRDGACAEGKSAMNRREFTTRTVAAAVALAFAGVARATAGTAGFESRCEGCGGRIWRGSRAYLLEQFGDDPRL